MSDIRIRRDGRTGRITLTRPEALNALTHEMCLAIDAALIGWSADADVALVLIDAEGERAFCAGGDIAMLHATGSRGDLAFGRRFWRDEYRMNARIAAYPKPVVSLMQGFAMGGGVGLGCHASVRLVGDTSRLAMPECSIGLVPDVGGSLLLARAPGATGRFLGLTGARMGPGCAIFAGFADYYLPEADWPELVAALVRSGDATRVAQRAVAPPESPLAGQLGAIASVFLGDSPGDIFRRLVGASGGWAELARRALARNSPLSMACALEMQKRMTGAADIRDALRLEYRFTHRAMEQGDFIEGVRAAIIDRDNAPRWRHGCAEAVSPDEVAAMLAPLGAEEWTMGEDRP